MVGSKGGVGATTASVALAKHYSSTTSTLLVDGDLSGRRASAVLFNALGKIDERRANDQFAVAEVAPNLALFEMAANIHDGFTIKPERVDDLLKHVAGTIEMIVVDAPQPFAAAVRPFAVRAANFVMLVEPSVLGVTGARVMQHELSRFGVPQSHLKAVIANRGRSGAERQEVERALGLPVLAELPAFDDRKFGKSIDALAEKITSTMVRLPDLLVLQPSASTPLGERRMGARRDQSQTENAPKAAAEQRKVAERMEQSARDDLKSEIHRELSRRIDFAAIGGADQLKIEGLRAEVEGAVAEIVANRQDVGSAEDVARLHQEIIDEALGLGPLEELFADPDVSEVMVNGPDTIYIERKGLISKTHKRFNDSRQLRLVIERIISPLGRHIDESTPMVDARLADGSRVNATIEPVSIDGPTITIRRFAKYRLGPEDLISKQTLTPQMVDLLRATVEGRLNIVISGGTGSGKTTLLNVLSNFLPDSERILTIEDAAELQLNQDHVIRMEARPANVEGRGEIRIRDLVKNALRMRPDRIVVGECRGGEALDMLQAMNTGHDGSLTTVHANSARDCLSRIETMVLMAGFDIPVRAIREQIAGAVDVIVQVARLRDGSRKITGISEVVGMEADVITTQEIIRFDQRGLSKDGHVEGAFVYTGVQPTFMKRLDEYGITYDMSRLSDMQLAATAW